jgi:hypothetical protein
MEEILSHPTQLSFGVLQALVLRHKRGEISAAQSQHIALGDWKMIEHFEHELWQEVDGTLVRLGSLG